MGHSRSQKRYGCAFVERTVSSLDSIMTLRPFHLAFPVHDLERARDFYGRVLGCRQGRSDATWIDFDLYGHQVVAHLDSETQRANLASNPVDGDAVPVPHFGVVLTMEVWSQLKERLLAHEEVRWIIRPRTRFKGQVGEQATLFFLDPSGNALEFKAFADDSQLFAT